MEWEMPENICIECGIRPVYVKKRRLCKVCYSRFYKKSQKDGGHIKPKNNLGGFIIASREIQFIKNFFNHKNWQFRPAIFELNGFTYSPDFYDRETDTFIEVSGTRQAYFQNKAIYQKFRELYPKINFEIRNKDGELIDESRSINSQV